MWLLAILFFIFLLLLVRKKETQKAIHAEDAYIKTPTRPPLPSKSGDASPFINETTKPPKKSTGIPTSNPDVTHHNYSKKKPLVKSLVPILGVFIFLFLVIVLSDSNSGSTSSASNYNSNSYYPYSATYLPPPTADFPSIPTFDPIDFDDLFEDTTPSITPSTTNAPTETVSLKFISWPKVTRRNEDVKVKIKGEPYTKYCITVYYSSGPSTAEGLEPKFSNSEGYVVWEWHVGGKTNPGTFSITVTGGGETKSVSFTVTT